MDRKIKTGIIGYGKSAEIFHAPLLHAHPGFEIKTVVERHAQKSKERYPGVSVVNDLDHLLEDREIELIVITTPNLLHFEQVKQALEANKNVVVEKPFTVRSDEAETLIGIAQQKGKTLSVFQNRRWDSDFLTIHQLLKTNLLGEMVEYEAHFDRFRDEIKDAWKEKDQPGSGILYDLGSHLIDQAVYLFGLPSDIYGDIRTQRKGAKTADNFELLLFYPNLKVTLKAGMLVKGELPKYILHGTKGSFIKYGLDVQEEHLKLGITPGVQGWGEEPKSDHGTIDTLIGGLKLHGKIQSQPGNYLDYYTNIYEVVVEGKQLAVQPEEALITIRIIEAAIESNKQKRVISLEATKD